MVKGVGIDIVEIARIEKLVIRYHNHFTEKVFTQSEIKYCSAKACPSIHFAGRWAAKEAFYKALPFTAQKYATWKSIAIENSAGDLKPHIVVCSMALKNVLQNCNIERMLVSISHERKYCTAVVTLE